MKRQFWHYAEDVYVLCLRDIRESGTEVIMWTRKPQKAPVL